MASGQIKTGAPCRSERLAKYNQSLAFTGQLWLCGFRMHARLRLLRIEEELGSKAGGDHE